MRTVLCQRSLAHQTPSRISFRTPPPEGSGGSGAVRWMARRKAHPLHTSQTTDQGASDPRLDQEEAPALLLARFRRTFSFLSEVSLSEVPFSRFLVRDSSSAIPRPHFSVRASFPVPLAHEQHPGPRRAPRARDPAPRGTTAGDGADTTRPLQPDRPAARKPSVGRFWGRSFLGSVVFRWIVCGVDRTESSAPHASFDAPRAHFAAKRAQAARSNVKS